MTVSSTRIPANLLSNFASSNYYAIELGHVLHETIPTSPSHPEFRMTLARRHGDRVRSDGGSSANEIIITGGHTGTHVDALAHVSQNGRLYSGIDCFKAQLDGKFSSLGAETIPPFICRGVLLDVARVHGVKRLSAGQPVTGEDLQEAAHAGCCFPRQEDVALVRTGWAQLWGFDDSDPYLGQTDGAPGIDLSGARWLSRHGVSAAGCDTTAFECIPPGLGHAVMPVHRVLLVDNGIHIVEHLDLENLSQSGVTEFLFVMLPLRIVGGTGSPVRPVAIVESVS
ncbi:cyclase family protein [Cutibacterium granulosum]|uniref:cyclase family protein n=1 Tax=Cutibacterium granulosum TaxID=33011 RepID=UPI0027B93316|nr:cyclase family protein [Cutibacterium granulosum]